jgi:hypothetical protein
MELVRRCDSSATDGPMISTGRAGAPIAARATERFSGARDRRRRQRGMVRIGVRTAPQGSPVKNCFPANVPMVVEVRVEMSPSLRAPLRPSAPSGLMPARSFRGLLLALPLLHAGVGFENINCQSCIL